MVTDNMMIDPARPKAVPGFAPPSPAAHIIERTRLDRRYADGRGCLVRVLAPAGYGKTTIGARWVAAEERTVSWIDVEKGDNDPVALWLTLRLALAGIADLPRPTPVIASDDDVCVRTIRQAMADTAARHIPFVLVLDDVHLLRSASAGRILHKLVEHLPAESTVMLLGRTHHDDGSVGRLRLTPGVVDLSVEDLAFTPTESRRLLESAGAGGAELDVTRIWEFLEGWPAGLRLTARALATGASADAIEDRVEVVDYLRKEWVGQLDPDDLTFLRELACLGSCTGELCDQVLQRSGSSAVLRRLHRDEVVVFPLEARDGWYRLHPLLQRWLSHDLREVDLARWTTIHSNAAAYWEGVGEINRAVEHASTADDLGLRERLVATHGGVFFTRGLEATARRWLDSFPPAYVRSSPGLAAICCVRSLHDGDFARAAQWLRVMDDALTTRGPAGVEAVRWWGGILHAALDQRPASELIPVAEESCNKLSGGAWAAFACWVLGGLHFMDGDSDRARTWLQQGMFEAEVAGSPRLHAHCLAAHAVVDDACGDRAAAEDKCTRAATILEQSHSQHIPPAAPAMAVEALINARHLRRDAALRRMADARQALTGFTTLAPWFNVITRLALVRTSLLLDDRDTASTLLRELEQHTGFEPTGATSNRQGAIACLRDLQQRVDAMHRPASGAAALTDAELRVLQHLPTNLTVNDIATRLYLSRNTVKSHIAAIYRKLGTNNRTAAVELAESAGLTES